MVGVIDRGLSASSDRAVNLAGKAGTARRFQLTVPIAASGDPRCTGIERAGHGSVGTSSPSAITRLLAALQSAYARHGLDELTALNNGLPEAAQQFGG